jgi:hypothetical protein
MPARPQCSSRMWAAGVTECGTRLLAGAPTRVARRASKRKRAPQAAEAPWPFTFGCPPESKLPRTSGVSWRPSPGIVAGRSSVYEDQGISGAKPDRCSLPSGRGRTRRAVQRARILREPAGTPRRHKHGNPSELKGAALLRRHRFCVGPCAGALRAASIAPPVDHGRLEDIARPADFRCTVVTKAPRKSFEPANRISGHILCVQIRGHFAGDIGT